MPERLDVPKVGAFSAPPQFLLDDKIESMNAAELRAEAHQRGWDLGPYAGDRATRVKFWQVQRAMMPIPKEIQMAEELSREEQHQRNVENRQAAARGVADQSEDVKTDELSDEEADALEKMRENERKNAMPGIQPAPDNRTAQQKAEIDSNLESKRDSGVTGEPEQVPAGTKPASELSEDQGEGDEEVSERSQSASGKDAEATSPQKS